MYQLYFSPGACSMAIHVVLNEIGAEVQLIDASIAAGKTKEPEFLTLNPQGQVPLLVDEGKALREGAAQIIYLCEKHGCDLLPKGGAARTEALQWLMIANSSLHPAYARAFFLKKNAGTDEATMQHLYKAASASIQKLWDEIEAQLEGRDYLCGNHCTAADILITVIANWSGGLKEPVTFGTRTKALFKRIIERQSYKKALEREQVEYRAAA